MQRINSFFVRSIFFVLLLLFPSQTAFGQFSLVSSYPTHGTINVDTSATFSITFNAPIDTTARFPYPEGLFINLFIYPKELTGEPDSITFSSDMQTVYFHNLHLVDNIQYLFVLVDAVSMSGDSLDQPYSMVFTTSTGLHSASVSGTITYPGLDPSGTWVVLLDEYPFSEDSTGVVNGIVIPPSINFYTIDYVWPGYYWPVAIKNFHVNEEGDPIFELGSGVGFYDPDGDYIIDSIEVTTGAQITDIDFSLHTVIYQTARDPFPAIQTAASTWAPDAFFAGLFAEVEPDGNGLLWQYLFYSPSLDDHTGWIAVGDLIIRGEISDVSDDTLEVPTNWLDSDTILGITEANGGFEFRQFYPDAQIQIFLGRLYFNESNATTVFSSFGKGRFNFSINTNERNNYAKSQNQDFKSIVKDNGIAIDLPVLWGVMYYSPSANVELIFVLDPLTGEILSAPATASVAEQIAFPFAQSWSSDAKLYMVLNHFTPVDNLGKTQMWMSVYYSPGKDSLNGVVVWGKLPVNQGPIGFPPFDTLTVPAGWLDSDVTIAVAEAAGGANYRITNQNVFVNAYISRWREGPNPNLTVWTFTYTSSTAPDLIIIVDAFSGLIVDVKENEQEYYPDEFALYQNYPNPFNPSTTIKFKIADFGFTTLKVYDVLGNEVATLVNEELPAGEYEVEFNGHSDEGQNLTSGVYFYKMNAGDFVNTKKMILIR